MLQAIRPACVMLILLSLLTGIAYPLAVTLAAFAFPYQATGSIVTVGGKAVGSELIGQTFSKPEHFWGRLSATTPAYNGASSSGSNLGPLNPALQEAAQARIEALRKYPTPSGPVPVDLVTSSGSGLDPHISPAAAAYQVQRVAAERKMQEDDVRRLVARATSGRQMGILGEPTVNVLQLNLALDRQASPK